MKLDDLGGSDVVLLGLGAETLGVLPHLTAVDVGRIRVVERAPLRADQADTLRSAGVEPGDVLVDLPDTAEVVLRSPGFPAHRPDVTTLSETAQIATTPTGLWLTVRGGRRTIAVTGTKGKSSTVTLIATGLAQSGIDGFTVGNIGTPTWSIDPHRGGVAVVELSSYHGADLLATAQVTVLTLLAEDHVEWHGSLEAYRRDKLRVLSIDQADGTPPSFRIVPADQELPEPLASQVTRVAVHGDYRAHNVALAVAAIQAELGLDVEPVPSTDELTSLLASHYPELPGRFQEVPTDDGITWVDDALGSNPSATAAALERIVPGPAVLICGGHDRHVSLDPVMRALDKWPTGALGIVWLGDAEDHRLVELAGHRAVTLHTTSASVAEAVPTALGFAAGLAGDAGSRTTIIFSPLAPTEPVDGVWSDRSRAFQGAIAAL